MIYVVERAINGIRGRWKRNMLVAIAIALTSASFVVMLALSMGSSNAILRSLGAGDTSRVQVALPPAAWALQEVQLIDGLAALEGVREVGTFTSSDSTGVTLALTSSSSPAPINTAIAVATGDGLNNREIEWVDGGSFPSTLVLESDPRQVILGARVATSLGVSARPGDNLVMLNGSRATVVGIVTETGDSALLTASAVVPPQLVADLTRDPPARVIEMLVSSELSSWVAEQAPLAVWPQDPSAVSVAAPADPQQLRGRLEAETEGLIAAVTWVMVGVSIFVIANTMQIAIGERRKEIGVSRAFGLSPVSVGAQFFLEASILGFIGALVGVLVGGLVAAAVAVAATWEMLLPPLVAAVPFAGLILGGIGGLVPAWLASRVRPLELLRSE